MNNREPLSDEFIMEAVHTYCDSSPDNDYVLRDVGVLEGINALRGGVSTPVYCLSTLLDYPPPGRRYSPADFEGDRAMLDAVMCFSYPNFEPDEMFYLLGVDPAQAPPLDAFDARAVVQAVIWRVTEPGNPYLVDPFFALCADEFEPHTKNPRLYRAARNLFDSAVAARRDALHLDISGARGFIGDNGLNTVGPLVIRAEGACSVTVRTDPPNTVILTDAHGKRITPCPGIPFYAAACPGTDRVTLRLYAKVTRPTLLPLFDVELEDSPYQPVGLPICCEVCEEYEQELVF